MGKKGAAKGKGKKKGGAKKKGGGGSLQEQQAAFLKQKEEEPREALRSFVKSSAEESIQEGAPVLLLHSSARVEVVGRKGVDEIKGLGMVNRGERLAAGMDVLVCEGLAFDDSLFEGAGEGSDVIRKLGLKKGSKEWTEEQWSLVVLDKLFREWRSWKKSVYAAFTAGEKVFSTTAEQEGGGGLSYGEVWSILFTDLYPRTAEVSFCPAHMREKSFELVDTFLTALDDSAIADLRCYAPGPCWTAAAQSRARREAKKAKENGSDVAESSGTKEEKKEEAEEERERVKEPNAAMTKESVREELARLCMIILFNSHGYHQHHVTFRQRGSEETGPAPRSDRVQGIFPKGAFFNHSCWPNCEFFVLSPAEGGAPDQLHVRTTRPVEVGEELTVAYIDLLAPRTRRQLSLKEKYGFMCACRRCAGEGPADAIEADSLLAGLACRADASNCGGVMTTTEEISSTGVMVCSGCRAEYDISANFKLPELMKEMFRTLDQLSAEYTSAMGLRDPRAREAKVLQILGQGEEALDAATEVFHRCHFLVVLFTLRMALFTKGLPSAATKAHHYYETLLKAAVRIFPPGHFFQSVLYLDDAAVLHQMGQAYLARLSLRKGKELLAINRGSAIAASTIERLAKSW